MTRGSKSPGQEPLSHLPLKPQAGRGGGTHVCTPTRGRARSPLVRPRAMQQEGSHRSGKSTHCDLPTVSGRQLGVEPRTWPPEDGSAPLQNLSPVLRRVNQEPGFLSWFCWFLSGPQSVWTARTTVLKGFFFKIFIYLAASGLSCSTQDLCSIMQGLLLWFRLLCVVLRLQSTWAQ